MRNRIEAAAAYTVNLAQRIVGLEAAKIFWAEHKPVPEDPNFKSTRRSALIGSAANLFLQVATPAIYRGVMYDETLNDDNRYLGTMSIGAGIIIDSVNLLILSISAANSIVHSHDPVGPIVVKLITNTVSNVGADVIDTVVNKIRHHRPTGTTLAV